MPELEQSDLVRRLRRQRGPYSARLELTQRCDNRCVHCYLDPASGQLEPDQPLGFWLELVDVLAAEGCLWLTLTGGEPLLRPDFATIYESAKRRGMLVAVMTNARRVTEEIADLLHELPPHEASVSIYGATRETYEAVSRAPGSFDEAMAGIERLRRRNVPAHLKTMALRRNVHELDQMASLAESLGWAFRYDAAVFPARGGGKHVLAERLAPEAIVELDMKYPERREAWADICERTEIQPSGNRLYSCDAGNATCFVSAGGFLSPCTLLTSKRWRLEARDLAQSFRRAFYEQMPQAMAETVSGEFPCGECKLYHLCRVCAPWRELEVGSALLPCEFGCRVAQLRAEALGIDEVPPPLRSEAAIRNLQ